MKKITYLALISFCLLLNACASKFIAISPLEADVRNQAYMQQNLETQISSITGSIRLSDPEQSVRLNYILWSNGTYPLRIDLMHSQAGIMAKILEDKQTVQIYTPENNQVNRLHGSSDSLMINGIRLPFGLLDINGLIQNQTFPIFGTLNLDEVYDLENGLYRYKVQNGTVDINIQGQVVAWQEKVAKPWTMFIEYDENFKPATIKFENMQEQKVNIYIKSVQNYPKPYTAEKLELVLPNDVIIKDIK